MTTPEPPSRSVPHAPRPGRATANPVTDLAQTLLYQARTDYEVAWKRRLRAMRAARRVGLTNQQIATPLGVTEAAVRTLLRRHPEN